MPVTAKVFNAAATALSNKEISWSVDTIKVMLVTNVWVPIQGTHNYKDDVTNEVVGTGYVAGGIALTAKTEAFVGQVKQYDAADVTWPTSTITARYAVVYDDSPAIAATKPVICYIDFGADVISAAGDFTIQWSAAGVFTAAVS